MAILEGLLAMKELAPTAMEAAKELAEKIAPSAKEALDGASQIMKQTAQTEGVRASKMVLNNTLMEGEKIASEVLEHLGEKGMPGLDEIMKITESEVWDEGTFVKKMEIEGLKETYVEDIFNRSEFSETIDKEMFENCDFEKISPEENGARRLEFNEMKEELKAKWEEQNNQEWPTYKEDVYHNGKCIRRAGDAYDAHHIHPLGMGGENSARNLTPMHALDHTDKWGIHAVDSAYARLEKALGEL